jgi:hypothetical protein
MSRVVDLGGGATVEVSTLLATHIRLRCVECHFVRETDLTIRIPVCAAKRETDLPRRNAGATHGRWHHPQVSF